MKPLLAFAAAMLLLAPAAASDARDLPAPPLALTKALEAIVEVDGASGVAALVYRDGRLVYQAQVGTVYLEEPLPVGSASSWVATALIMTFVDEGRFSLDEPIGLRMATGEPEAGQITLRQVLSFTSGHGSIVSLAELAQSPDITLAESAARILGRPLEYPPGAVFKYGSGTMQIAGALVEQVTGQRWEDIFQERLASPLGMSQSWWSHPLYPDQDPATVTNPDLQHGLVTTAGDFGKFLTMIANGGSYGDVRILSEHAVELMETLQTGGVDIAYIPSFGEIHSFPHHEAELPGPLPTPSGESNPSSASRSSHSIGYALGAWCERFDNAGRCLLVSNPGALGTWPWVDRESGVYGLFVMQHCSPRVARNLTDARKAVLDAVLAR